MSDKCPGCGRDYKPEMKEEPVKDLQGYIHFETVILKYCQICRDEMQQALKELTHALAH